jgi:GTP-binding protein
MQIKTASFVISNSDYRLCPAADRPEYAFIGRSNVGKSSLINMLTGVTGLAKTSARPGKTQLINHFLINQEWYLVDLPGYGYAKVSQTDRAKFAKMIEHYLQERANLLCVLVLIDIRLEPQKIDVEFIGWLGEQGIPFVILFTKADKLAKSTQLHKVEAYRAHLLQFWEEAPRMLITSAETKQGRDEVLQFIEQINQENKNQ